MAAVADLAGIAVGAGRPVRVMAVINVSPESFYSGSVAGDEEALRAAVRQAGEEGADLIDIGAASTAPYRKTAISPAEETRRLVWALQIALPETTLPISADTRRAEVAATALAAGARIINDVSGLRGDPVMADVAAQAEGVVLMASEPPGPIAEPPLDLVRRLLEESLERADRAGIPKERIVLDPGIGFFTGLATPGWLVNCLLIARLGELSDLGRPLLIGVSRKAFLGRLTGRGEPSERLWGSLAATAVAVHNGAAVIRAHDVGATRDAVRVAEALRDARDQ